MWRVLSQIILDEARKWENKIVQIFVKVGGDDKQKLLLGNLSKKIPRVSLNLMFEQEF